MEELPLKPVGNILGAARAEVDALLASAFVETAAYRALTENTDYNFVVGRRGTGKSALFTKLTEHFAAVPQTVVVADVPQEHHILELQNLMTKAVGTDYRMLRAISRLVWRASLLFEALHCIERHYKFTKLADRAFLGEYVREHKALLTMSSAARCVTLAKMATSAVHHGVEIAPAIATIVDIDKLQQVVANALRECPARVVVLSDGLDEGWMPDIPSTAVLGGLAMATADLTDRKTEIHSVLFVRDNIFRALAQLDNDFTRHIEGHTLRLHWDENSLLHLVAQRLRITFGLRDIESDVRVWNRFAHRALQERDGFLRCLHHTLYRPRDVIVLLNDAYANATREHRYGIVEDDVEQSARQISQHRLEDLLKEYETVFPGLTLFVDQFKGRPAQEPIASVRSILDEAVAGADYENPAARDFGIFNSGSEIFSALYSVGFLGVQEAGGVGFTFCHDGAQSTLGSVEATRLVTVHPCYWKALDLQGDTPPEEVMIRINDEYKAKPSAELGGMRTALLGEIHGALPRLPVGTEGYRQFEEWVFRTIKVLFAGRLANPQLKPNPGAVQQRDVVATNTAAQGFWKRIWGDYHSRQVVFEVKNYEELGPDDFRQLSSYLTGEYGNFGIIVSRAKGENPTESERAWIRTMWAEHRQIIMIVPAVIFARCVSKLRSPRRYDYTEDTLNKRMDQLVRSYLSIPQAKKFRRKKKK
jgi:hypothetical protein